MVDYSLFVGGEDGPDGQVAAAIDDVTRAFDTAIQVIRNIQDPVQAFHWTSELWSRLRRSTDANGHVRQRMAALADEAHHVDLTSLAELLSTEAHQIGKARAGQLVADGKRLLAAERQTPEPGV